MPRRNLGLGLGLIAKAALVAGVLAGADASGSRASHYLTSLSCYLHTCSLGFPVRE